MDFSMKDRTAEFDQADIQANKGITILAYISWLVLVPLLARKTSKFARYHSNQGFILAIIGTAIGITNSIISSILFFSGLWGVAVVFNVIFSLLGIPVLVLMILGIVNVAKGRAVDLPIISSFKIFK